jgi:hypothetical protein
LNAGAEAGAATGTGRVDPLDGVVGPGRWVGAATGASAGSGSTGAAMCIAATGAGRRYGHAHKATMATDTTPIRISTIREGAAPAGGAEFWMFFILDS